MQKGKVISPETPFIISHMGDFPQPQQKYAGTGENGNFEIAVVF